MDKLVNEFSKELQKKIQNNEELKYSGEIEVFEENGVVTLEGAVASQEELNNIEAYIQKQEGVKAVVNKLDIDSSLDENDEEIDIDKEDYVPPVRHHTG